MSSRSLVGSLTVFLFIPCWGAAEEMVTEIATIKGHEAMVRGVDFSPNGEWLATASTDGTVKVWDAKTVKERFTLKHDSGAFAVAFSYDSLRLASGGLDGKFRISDCKTGKEQMTIEGHGNLVSSLQFYPSGDKLLSAGFDKSVNRWDLSSGKSEWRRSSSMVIMSARISPDGKFIAYPYNIGGALAWAGDQVRIFDSETDKMINEFLGSGNYSSLAFSPNNELIAVGSSSELSLWSVSVKKAFFKSEEMKPINSTAYSPVDNQLIATGGDKDVALWNAKSGKILLKLKGHQEPVCGLAFSPDGKTLATASDDMTVKLWDISKLTGVERAEKKPLPAAERTEKKPGPTTKAEKKLLPVTEKAERKSLPTTEKSEKKSTSRTTNGWTAKEFIVGNSINGITLKGAHMAQIGLEFASKFERAEILTKEDWEVRAADSETEAAKVLTFFTPKEGVPTLVLLWDGEPERAVAMEFRLKGEENWVRLSDVKHKKSK